MRVIERVIRLSVVFVILFTIDSSQSLFSKESEVNLVHNPGFEETVIGKDNELLPKNWLCYNKECSWYEKPKGKGMSKWSLDSEIVHGGKYSLKVTGDGNRGMSMQTLYAKDGIEAGKYQFKVWIKTDGAAAVIYLGHYTTGGKNISNDTFKRGGEKTVWMEISKIITTPANCGGSIKIMLSTGVPNYGEVWFDDISLVKLPPSVDI